jgi:protoporphyrinogen/coproporphyrinogen III oxidase
MVRIVTSAQSPNGCGGFLIYKYTLSNVIHNNDQMSKADIVIIGAGLTGLTAAYYLKKNGYKVILIEKNNRTGGVIDTVNEDGFVIETGPNTGVLSHPEVAELFEDLSGKCTLETANPESKRRLIWKSGEWHALPDGLGKAIKTPLFSLGDKFRILGEPFRRKGTNPFETLEELVLRRMGRSYLDYAVDPFISGIYAGNPSYLVTRFALPKLYALEQNYGSFIKGAIRKGFEPVDPRMKKATKEVFSAENGLHSLITALEDSIGKENILLNAKDTVIGMSGDKYSVIYSLGEGTKAIETEHVITTVDAGALESLLPFISREDLSAITNLEYAKVVQVVLAYKEWEGIELNAFGGLVPTRENRRILGVLFTSSFFKNRAPEKGALLSVFLGGTKRPGYIDLSDAEIKKIVFEEVSGMFKISDPKPHICRIFRYHRAIPQYGKTSEERLKAIKEIQEKYPGLILAGGIRDGIGMADRIKQACLIASEISVSKSVSETSDY